jgi:hypothetical protein
MLQTGHLPGPSSGGLLSTKYSSTPGHAKSAEIYNLDSTCPSCHYLTLCHTIADRDPPWLHNLHRLLVSHACGPKAFALIC